MQAYFKDPRGEVHHLFGKSQLHHMLQSCKLPSEAAFQLPIEVDVNSACDEGIPVVVHRCADRCCLVRNASTYAHAHHSKYTYMQYMSLTSIEERLLRILSGP